MDLFLYLQVRTILLPNFQEELTKLINSVNFLAPKIWERSTSLTYNKEFMALLQHTWTCCIIEKKKKGDLSHTWGVKFWTSVQIRQCLNVAETVICSLNFLPGHKARLHFPEPLAVMWDHMAEYWWMNVDRVMYTTSNLAPKNLLPNLLCSLFLSFFVHLPAGIRGSRGGLQGTRGWPIPGRDLGIWKTTRNKALSPPPHWLPGDWRNEFLLCLVIGMFGMSVSAIRLHWLKWLPESSLEHKDLGTYS